MPAEINSTFVYLTGTILLLLGLISVILLLRILGAVRGKGAAPAAAGKNAASKEEEIVAAITSALAEELGRDYSDIRVLSYKRANEGGTTMRRYNVKVNGTAYEVEIEEIGGSPSRGPAYARPPMPRPAPVAAAPAPAAPEAQAEQAAQAEAPVAVAEGERVAAPMPGTILDVRVSEGQSVKKGQPLMILEAMKMENEIMAPRDGVILQINTAKGSSVKTGDPLCVLG